MKRITSVDAHPKKDEIVKKIISGKSFRDISGQYGISKSSLSRYLNDHLIKRAAKIKAERDLKDGNYVLDELSSYLNKMDKLLSACDEYLTDPNDPEKYTLYPRAWEQEIRFFDYSDVKSDNAKPKLRKMTVQALIDEMRGYDKEIDLINNKFQDPRKVITEAASVLSKQLELLARIQGSIKDVSINIIQTPVWKEVQDTILKATEDFPEIREQLAKKFYEMSKAG